MHYKTNMGSVSGLRPSALWTRAAHISILRPPMARQRRVLDGRGRMRTPGHYVHGLDELERELDAPPGAYDTFPRDTAWTATLVPSSADSSPQRPYLNLSWFQEGGDPFVHLGEILSALDFSEHSVTENLTFFPGHTNEVPFGMRPMKNKQGIAVTIESIQGEFARAGMLEGTPYLGRKLRLLQGRHAMERPGCYVDGLDALEQEIARLDRSCDVWAPDERWSARLVTPTDWPSCLRRHVHIYWYQDVGDPFARLATIFAELDFIKYCATEKDDPDEE